MNFIFSITETLNSAIHKLINFSHNNIREFILSANFLMVVFFLLTIATSLTVPPVQPGRQSVSLLVYVFGSGVIPDALALKLLTRTLGETIIL